VIVPTMSHKSFVMTLFQETVTPRAGLSKNLLGRRIR
jgi:hypothetical protein